MYEITIIKSFSAAHMLAGIGCKCEELHGHNFKVEVTVAAQNLNSAGILIDFRDIKKWLNEIIDNLDHKHLNELFFFNHINPSSENIARYIFQEMTLRTNPTNVNIVRVKVWESENSAVTYIKD
jgi:6-pyruvoyltetrahydropterin/6-carboxytetrahydropterin synthase